MMIKKPGYILMLTLLIMSIAVALISVVVQQSFSFQRQSRIAADKDRARMLVTSSLALVESQLSLVIPEEKESKDASRAPAAGERQTGQQNEDKKDKLEPMQEWLLKAMPLINRWQTVTLSGDNLDGKIAYYIAAEQGKIPLGLFEVELFQEGDQKSKEQEQKDSRQGAQGPAGATQTEKKSPLSFFDELIKKEHGISIQEGLKKFVGTHRRMPEDVTELLRLPSFIKMKERTYVTQDEKKPFFLMDLFSSKKSKGINPWLLSASIKTLLGIKAAKGTADKGLVKKMRGRLRWDKDWDTIVAQLYGKKFDALPKGLGDYLSPEFEANSFSVVSYCTVGSVTLKIYALFERIEPEEELSPKSVIFKATKLIWL